MNQKNVEETRKNLTENIASFVSSVSYDDVEKSTLEAVEIFFVDYLASCCAGFAFNNELNRSLEKIILGMGGNREATVLFHSERKYPALHAALINAAYAHGADYDDGNKNAMGHVGTHVFPSVMALCDLKKECKNRSFVEGILVGYEVFCRIAAAAQPGMVDRGLHSTGYAGAIACAAAGAKVLNLSHQEIYQAVSLAATQSSGLLIVGETNQQVKPLNPAKAAHSGVLAVLLARDGVMGPEGPLESNRGWFKSASDDVNWNNIEFCPEGKHAIEECYLKPWPSCRHTHSALEAASRLCRVLDLADVENIEVKTYGNAIRLAGMKAVPETADEAKFSIQYATAMMLSRGRFGLRDLDPRGMNDLEKKVATSISLHLDESYENLAFGVRGAGVTVKCKDGRIFSEEVMVPLGDPEHPIEFNQELNKLKDACGYAEEQGVRIQSSLDSGHVKQYAKRLVGEPDKIYLPLESDSKEM